jgi:hypothetical protein
MSHRVLRWFAGSGALYAKELACDVPSMVAMKSFRSWRGLDLCLLT